MYKKGPRPRSMSSSSSQFHSHSFILHSLSLNTTHSLKGSSENFTSSTMQFKIQFSLLAAMLATTVFGAAVLEVVERTPTELEGKSLSPRVVNLITVCKNKQFGDCRNFAGDINRCCECIYLLPLYYLY